MTDESIRLAVPAITLGYSVSNDRYGKFIFHNDECSIYYRNGIWNLTDATGVCYEYSGLMEALQAGAIDD